MIGSRPWSLATALVAAWTGCVPLLAQEPDSARAEPPDSARYRVEELTVRAARPLATASGASAVRLSLASPRLRPVPLLGEALRELPFVQVRENSRGEEYLTLRGTESRQVAVLVDGIPLTLGWDARTDLSVVPLSAAREIQLFRGVSSVLHGPNVLGGVVEVDVAGGKEPRAFPGPAVDVGVDATGATVGAARAGGTWGAGSGTFSLQAGVGLRHRDQVPLADGVVQDLAGAPEGLDHRLNSDLRHTSGFASARYASAGGAWASLSTFAFDAEKGVPPELHVDDPRLWRYPEQSRFVTVLSGGTAFGTTPLGRGDLEASIGIDLGETRIDAFETAAYETIAGQEWQNDRTLTFRLLGDHSFGAGTLRAAFTAADARHDERIDQGARDRFRQRLYSTGLEVEQPVYRGGGGVSEVRLTAGGSWDRASTPETGGREAREPIDAWGARLGGSALVGDATRLQAGISRRVRFPSLRELYSGALGRFVPNPDLRPEVLRTIEAGATHQTRAGRGRFEGQLVLFHQRFSDAIVRTGLGDGRFMRENRDQIRSAGVEVLGSYVIGDLQLAADLTLQDVSLTDSGSPAAQRRPEYQPEAAGSLDLQVPVWAGIHARSTLEYVGVQSCVDPDGNGDLDIAASGRLDLGLGRRWTGGPLGGVRASLSLDNVTDSVVFDQCGLPQPGRLLRFQIRLG